MNDSDQNKTAKWIKAADKLNRTLQSVAFTLSKEAQAANPGGQYVLNSYAYHCKPLINSISSFLPAGFDTKKIENLFIDNSASDVYEQHPAFIFHTPATDGQDKIRKRMLISAPYTTAYKVKHIL